MGRHLRRTVHKTYFGELMKGIVEIYGTNREGDREILFQKENLTVVGFAENIVDLLTTPSSTVYPTSENSNILDASNYTVQAISTSKNKEHFRKNLHSYETSNLLNNTAFDETLDSSISGWTVANLTASTNTVDGYTEEVSGTLLQADTSGGYILQRVYFDGSLGNTDGKYSDRDIIRFADTVFSVDLKWNEGNPPVKLASTSDDGYISYSRLKYTTLGGATSGEAYVKWDASGGATLSKSTQTDFEAGIRYLGSKWYRVFIKAFNGIAATGDNFTSFIYPCNAEFLENSDVSIAADSSAGSIFMSRPQVELGRHPTKYQEVSSFVQTKDETVQFSLLNPSNSDNTKYDYYVASAGTGAYTLSGVYDNSLATALGVSAYIPSSTEVTPPPHPEDRYLTSGAFTPVEEALEVEIMQGQNPFILNTSSTLMLSSFGSPWTYASGYTPSIGRHSGFLNTYPGRSASSKIYLNIVSALDYEGYDNPLKTTSVYLGQNDGGIAATASLADIFGYINLSDNGVLPASTSVTSGKSSFYKLITSNFSSTGEIKHILQLGKGTTGNVGVDAPLLNLFGGVDTLGLWGMDVKSMRDADYSVSFPLDCKTDPTAALANSGSPLPKRRYKLYNKIVLTDNMVKNDGGGSDPGIFDNYENITVIWSLKFL